MKDEDSDEDMKDVTNMETEEVIRKASGSSEKKFNWINTVLIVGLIIGLVAVALVIMSWKDTTTGISGSILNNKNKNTNTQKVVKQIENSLDGVKVNEDLAKLHPLAIMIENHPDARPQAGLDKAAVVYEAIAEGGITRFMGIFGPYAVDAKNDKIGPVRSARTYYIDWLSEYNAFYAHVGGNLDALEKIQTEQIYDLDQFGLGEFAYTRIPKSGIAIEHTMYTSLNKLYAAAKNKNWKTDDNSTKSYTFKEASPFSKRGVTQKVTIDFSTPGYKVVWDYNQSDNNYARTMAGVPHNDQITGKQLTGSNIIVQEVERTEAITASNEMGYAMKTIGTGKALVFSEGLQVKATWKKTSETSRTKFYDETGMEIEFIPGQFWIEITPPEVFKTIKVE